MKEGRKGGREGGREGGGERGTLPLLTCSCWRGRWAGWGEGGRWRGGAGTC